MTPLTLVNRHSPHGQSDGLECLDLCLAAASFGQPVQMIFIDDGVFQLLKNQLAEAIEHRNFSKTFAALAFYDVEDIFVCEASLQQRGLSQDDLCIATELVSSSQLQSLLSDSTVLSF